MPGINNMPNKLYEGGKKIVQPIAVCIIFGIRFAHVYRNIFFKITILYQLPYENTGPDFINVLVILHISLFTGYYFKDQR